MLWEKVPVCTDAYCICMNLLYMSSGIRHNCITNICFQDSSEQIAPGISANIQSYQVSFIPTSEDFQFAINITIRDLTLCQDKCAVVISSTEMTSLYYSVFVTAENILGLGQRKSCNSQSIGKLLS